MRSLSGCPSRPARRSDRILVMDAGEIVEPFASPLELYDREGGIFRSLCDQSAITRDDIVRAARARAT